MASLSSSRQGNFQKVLKRELIEQYYRIKQDSEKQGENFPWTLDAFIQDELGYEWDGPPTPTYGIPNVKVDSSGSTSLDDDEGSQVPVAPPPHPPETTPITHNSPQQSSKPTDAAGSNKVAPRPTLSSAYADDRRRKVPAPAKIPGSIRRGTFDTDENSPASAKRQRTSHERGVRSPDLSGASSGAITSPTSPSSAASSLQPVDMTWGNDIGWLRETKVGRSNPQMSVQLSEIRFLTERCGRATTTPERVLQTYDEIRSLLHKFRHIKVDEQILKGSRLLERSGLPVMFLPGKHQYPFDIRADSKELAVRWRHHEFDPDILRHVNFTTSKSGKLDENRMKFGANHAGDGDLVNGQWFPIWLCAVRDGAHGSAQAGIYGKKGHGAYSIVMAGAYNDVDDGDYIEYCGVVGVEGSNVDANSTALLRENRGRPDRPVRVLRSSKLNSKYRPEKGLRYDGLYVVRDIKIVDERTRDYRFIMQRVPGQDPIRWEGLAKRPTQEEIDAFNLHRERLGNKMV